MNTAIFWPTGPTNQRQPMANLVNFYVFCPIWMKFGMWTIIGQKTTLNKFEISTAIVWLTTTTQTTAQTAGGGGARGSRGRGKEGPHHHQHDFTSFSLRREPPLLVNLCMNLVNVKHPVVFYMSRNGASYRIKKQFHRSLGSLDKKETSSFMKLLDY